MTECWARFSCCDVCTCPPAFIEVDVSLSLLYFVRDQTGDVCSRVNTHEQTHTKQLHVCPWSNVRLPKERAPWWRTFASDQTYSTFARRPWSISIQHKQNMTLSICYAMHAYLHLSFHLAGKGSTVTSASSGCCCCCGYRDITISVCSSCWTTLLFFHPFLCCFFLLFSCSVLCVRGGDAGDYCGVGIAVVRPSKQWPRSWLSLGWRNSTDTRAALLLNRGCNVRTHSCVPSCILKRSHAPLYLSTACRLYSFLRQYDLLPGRCFLVLLLCDRLPPSLLLAGCFKTNFQGRQPWVWRNSGQYSSLQAALLVLVIYYIWVSFYLEVSYFLSTIMVSIVLFRINIIKIKIHSSCEIEDFVETHLCKLCVILRSRALRVVCPH